MLIYRLLLLLEVRFDRYLFRIDRGELYLDSSAFAAISLSLPDGSLLFFFIMSFMRTVSAPFPSAIS